MQIVVSYEHAHRAQQIGKRAHVTGPLEQSPGKHGGDVEDGGILIGSGRTDKVVDSPNDSLEFARTEVEARHPGIHE